MKPSRLLLPLVGVAALALAGCGSSSSSTPTSAPPPPSSSAASASPSSVASPSATSASSAPTSPSASASASATAAALTVDEHANGSTVHVPAGGSLLLVLHSTLWPFPQDSAPALLEQVGRPMAAHAGSCPPGQGCGTVTTRYLARQAGTVTLTDHRVSCGEARRCKPGEGDFRLTVVVDPKG